MYRHTKLIFSLILKKIVVERAKQKTICTSFICLGIGNFKLMKLKKFSRLCYEIIILVVLFFIYLNSSYFVVVVSGNSMSPTYYNHKILLANKNFNGIAIDDIVVAKIDGTTYIKRVTAVEGDYYIKSLTPPITYEVLEKKLINKKPRLLKYIVICQIPHNYYFLQGDNAYSYDSKNFGLVEKYKIMGKIVQ